MLNAYPAGHVARTHVRNLATNIPVILLGRLTNLLTNY
jgi:hypothetical protein